MEPEHSFVDQNSTFQSSSSSSSASLDDIEPEVKDQFVKLADALKETNQNLLTFEFLLAQYRKLARIEPFNAEKDALLQGDLRQQADEHGGSVGDAVDRLSGGVADPHEAFSRTTARACPTPMQMAATPHRAPDSCRRWARVPSTRAPEAPSG